MVQSMVLEGHMSVSLWNFDTEENGETDSSGNFKVSLVYNNLGVKVWSGVLNHFSSYNLISSAIFKVLTRGSCIWFR